MPLATPHPAHARLPLATEFPIQQRSAQPTAEVSKPSVPILWYAASSAKCPLNPPKNPQLLQPLRLDLQLLRSHPIDHRAMAPSAAMVWGRSWGWLNLKPWKRHFPSTDTFASSRHHKEEWWHMMAHDGTWWHTMQAGYLVHGFLLPKPKTLWFWVGLDMANVWNNQPNTCQQPGISHHLQPLHSIHRPPYIPHLPPRCLNAAARESLIHQWWYPAFVHHKHPDGHGLKVAPESTP